MAIIDRFNQTRISKHVMDRYQERIRPCDDPRAEIMHCLAAAKLKHLRPLLNKKNTVIIPTGCCFFIGSRGGLVSVVKTLREANETVISHSPAGPPSPHPE